MRCLYCGKELALLKRLTGSGEFCSESHKQNYQEEYNRLALSRLLQAQSRSEEVRAVATAVEEPDVEEPVVEEPVVEKPVVEEQQVVPEPAAQSEPDPPAAGFVVGSLEIRSVPFAGAASEGPLELAVHPVIPSAGLAVDHHDVNAAPPETGLLALTALQPRSRPIPSPETHGVSPKEFPAPNFAIQDRLSTQPPLGLASRGLTAFPVDALTPPAPVSWDYMRAPAFASAPGFEQSMRLDFRDAGLELPVADGPAVALVETAPRPVAEWTEPESPKLALEALTRMQREIAGEPEPVPPRRNGANSGGGLLVDTATLERAFAPRRERPPAIPSTPERLAPAAVIAEQMPASARSEAVAPAGVAAVIAMPLEIAKPPKLQPLAVFEAVTLPVFTPRLPRVDTFPLRPKIVPGSPPGDATMPGLRLPLAAVHVSVAGSELQTGPAVAPAAVPKPAPPAPPRPPQTSPSKRAPAKPAVSSRAPEPPRAKAAKPAGSPVPKPQTAKPKQEPSPEPSPELLDQPPVSVALKEAAGYEIPSLAYSANAGFWRSGRNIVILVAALLVALAIVLFLNSGSHKTTAAGAATADGVGPSIMMGEGGWITDWASDTRGQNRGRHVTMYRPSLTLSDYRIEFQARIESKSIGWVFRAASPDNYYLMKIQQSGPGRLELAKFVMIDGSQRLFSTVQLPAGIRPDALLSIRVDARGPRFATYVQGQPVDTWTDGQLKSGGVGFLNDRGERAHIQSVQISYLTGAAR